MKKTVNIKVTKWHNENPLTLYKCLFEAKDNKMQTQKFDFYYYFLNKILNMKLLYLRFTINTYFALYKDNKWPNNLYSSYIISHALTL